MLLAMAFGALSFAPGKSSENNLVLNDLEYFHARGVEVLVFNEAAEGGFNDEKHSGVEIIHHGVRTAQGGMVRLNAAPEQWDPVPTTVSRTVDKKSNSIKVVMNYPDYDFNSTLTVQGKGGKVIVTVSLDKPLPEFLVGSAGFNLELLPSSYWLKTYEIDSRLERMPRYAVTDVITRPNSEKPRQYKGYRTYDDRGTGKFIEPLPFDKGHKLILAPEDPERTMTVSSKNEIAMIDGRIIAQNGWYVLRSMIPAGKTGEVIRWEIEPGTIEGWVREPNIGFSQVGYHPTQTKVAVIELDANDKVQSSASIWRIGTNGKSEKVFTGPVTEWGKYFKYNYARFDFSSVRESGIYYIEYGSHKTGNFLIAEDVYDKVGLATSDVWIPIHMNHVAVSEGYRLWHGEPFKDGYLQAPPSTDHFDLHWQGPTTDTKFQALEHIPGLNVGGYFDAGDFDIETDANIGVISGLCAIWETYKPERDVTFVSEEQRFVELHRPDGVPDMLQYLEHAVLNIVAQAEIVGHMCDALSNSVLDNYHHLGDISGITDGKIYDPSLGRFEISADGLRSGLPDDMWAFTSRQPHLDLQAATALASAARVLKEHNPALAERALKEAQRLEKEATELMAKEGNNGAMRGPRGRGGNTDALLQLYISTGDEKYREQYEKGIWPMLEGPMLAWSISSAIKAVPYLGKDYAEKLRPYVVKYKETLDKQAAQTPYGVAIGTGGWAGGGSVISGATNALLAHKYFPDVVDDTFISSATSFVYGCHPYHNYSLAAALGAARPKNVFYGNNRADFSFIPGNVSPGVLMIQPDHFENYDEWPFFWGQNEGTILGNVSYLNFTYALNEYIQSLK